MATFNQGGQKVTTQYNADVIHVNERDEFKGFLESIEDLKDQLALAVNNCEVTNNEVVAATHCIDKAVDLANQEGTEKGTLIEELDKAKDLVSSVSGLFGAVFASVNLLFL